MNWNRRLLKTATMKNGDIDWKLIATIALITVDIILLTIVVVIIWYCYTQFYRLKSNKVVTTITVSNGNKLMTLGQE